LRNPLRRHIEPEVEPVEPPVMDEPPAATTAADDSAGEGTTAAGTPIVLHMPIDVRHVTFTLGAVVASIWLLRNTQEVLIPFVLSGLLFYALDPFVDRLEKWRIPRAISATVLLLSVIAGSGLLVYQMSDEVVAVIEQVPQSVRVLRNEWRQTGSERGALEKMQQAADAIDRTAAESAAPTPAPRGVTRVQIEEPPFRASDYLWSAGMTIPAALGAATMIFFLTLFLLIADDLFKRKLVKHVGAFARKKITVQILDEIGLQIERFILVQLFTSAVVAVVTGFVLWWLGLNQPAVWGLLAGILNSVPYFGPLVVSAGLFVVGFMQFGNLGQATVVAVVAIAITTLEGWVLTPLLLGRVAQMNHIAVFASLLFWTWVWGPWGLLLAIPITMAIKVVCDHIEPFRPIGDFLGE
jgi:predicted PurR-regulated permease PerM